MLVVMWTSYPLAVLRRYPFQTRDNIADGPQSLAVEHLLGQPNQSRPHINGIFLNPTNHVTSIHRIFLNTITDHAPSQTPAPPQGPPLGCSPQPTTPPPSRARSNRPPPANTYHAAALRFRVNFRKLESARQ